MSRTFRRKNYFQENNTSWDRAGKKVAGVYTEYERWTYREPTNRERYQTFKWAHLDAGTFGPFGTALFRRQRNKTIRQQSKVKIQSLTDKTLDTLVLEKDLLFYSIY